MPVGTVIRFKRGTAAQWTSVNPVLAAGEPGVETDTLKVKVGNGTSAWTALGYVGAGTVSYYNHITLSTNVAANTWASMPAAATEFGNTNRSRQRVLLTNAVDARLTIAVSTAGNTTAVIYVEYSTDQTTWVAMGLSQAVNVIGAFATAFVTVPVAARGDVWLRLAGSGGNGTLSPVFGAIGVGVRYAAPVT